MTGPERGYLLLCSELGTPPAPLTLFQLRQLRARVRASEAPRSRNRQLTQADLQRLGYDPAQAQRIAALFAREDALDAYLQTAADLGIGALSLASPDYPIKLRQMLGEEAPPVLFFRGERALLQRPMIALVGSRKLTRGGEAFAAMVGERAAKEGFVLVSGNAAGADRVAQEACLANGGSVIAVLSDSLGEHRPPERTLYLCEDGWHLPFSSQRALKRNRIIHALGLITLVAQTDCGSGGTWRGSVAALSIGARLFVQNDGSEGAEDLIARGATPVDPKTMAGFASLRPTQLEFS